MTTGPWGIRLATNRALLDGHAQQMLDAAEARGLETFVFWPFAKRRRYPYRLRIVFPTVVFDFHSGALGYLPADRPLDAAFHINETEFATIVSKQALREALLASGFPAPQGALFAPDRQADAVAYGLGLGGPVCVKPDRGSKGNGVTTGLTTADEIAAAFQVATTIRNGHVVVEQSLIGEVVRFFYVSPHVVGVKLSRPPSVVGDGAGTLRALIEAKNRERDVRALPGHKYLRMDDETAEFLARTGLTFDSVPDAGERVFLRDISNGEVGADTIECADAIHPSYIELVERICRSFPRLRVTALDTIITDRMAPASNATISVLELNNNPGVMPYMHPWEGRRQDVCGAMLDLMEKLAGVRT